MSSDRMSEHALLAIRNMRQLINEAANGRASVEGKRLDPWVASSNANLIRTALIMATREGWSGEDTMTWLAYHALVRCEVFESQLFQQLMVTLPSATLQVKETLKPPEQGA